MNRYIIFSKSNWRETPRLRHQFAELLRKFGGVVTFFQKPFFMWRWEDAGDETPIAENLELMRTRQLVHHQLRISKGLRWLNALVEKASIKRILRERFNDNSIIVNFNYDYFFLRDIFPNNKIITVINDDFVAQARFFSGRHAKQSLRQTCQISDVVLAVSYPLMDQVSAWCKPHLFFPWADAKYKVSQECGERKAVLLWAHIDARIDFELLMQSAKNRAEMDFYVVGPQAKNISSIIAEIQRSVDNLKVLPPTKLDELPLGTFFAAIIPYKNHIADIEAVTMSNKSLQLMSRGLPLVTHGMPNFYKHPAIARSNDLNSFLDGLDYCRENFLKLQEQIENLIENNQPQDRFSFLSQLIFQSKENEVIQE